MRYVIGIDLGTTNSCVAYVDTSVSNGIIQPFRIPQLTQAGYVENLATLPSCCYLAAANEWPQGSLKLPWKDTSDYFVGSFALVQGGKVPTRLVQSAKSWLCHAAANRRDKILPFEGASDQERISPVEATTRYLAHIRAAWNHVMARDTIEAEFEQQEIILTVPASFDEVARALTVEAARKAGFVQMTLLEEPQAAFYSWISYNEKSWDKQLEEGSTVLVCDVGGGTTDFSIIEVTGSGFQRMLVGDHLLLGGDNMDAAVAHLLEKRLDSSLSTVQWLQLCHQARRAKESLLSNEASYKAILQGAGAGVIKGSLAVEAQQEEIHQLLVDGFFGSYSWDEALQMRKAGGMRNMGLPYEDEPSITKHLATFLNSHTEPVKPDYVLFNGGTMKPVVFQNAILHSLKQWFPEKDPKLLQSQSLDLAVARGAAYYGKVRRGMGVKIGGGAARGYYLAVEVGGGSTKALTLLPRGSEEGAAYEPQETFWLMPNTPIAFHLYSSHVRLYDKSGDFVEIDSNQMQPLPQIHTVLRFGKQGMDASKEKVPVHLGIKLTPIGTLELWLISQKTEHRWALEFQLKTASGQDTNLSAAREARVDETFDASYLTVAAEAIASTFAGTSGVKSGQLMEHLERLLARPRREWSSGVLRGLWQPLLQQASQRKLSGELDARWWNLAGFFLRPGFGYPLDDYRTKELWKVMLGDLKVSKPLESQIQSWICMRRVSGGLNKGQQVQLAAELLPEIFDKRSGKIVIKNKGDLYQYSEKVRAIASLELIEISSKVKLGNAIVSRIAGGDAVDADFWALGRLAARHLIYGTAVNVVPRDVCSQWVESILKGKSQDRDQVALLLGQMARKTDHRELNLSPELITRILDDFHSERLRALLTQEGALTVNEQDYIFGDKLPLGLSLS